jgi:Cof subfamily protein (haloacid dehalogenase superfamily)
VAPAGQGAFSLARQNALMPADSPHLVAIDLDGTLLRSDGTVSARTAAALDRVQQAGARFVFVTGRPPRSVLNTLQPLGFAGEVICANGALTLDLRTGRLSDKTLIPAGVLAEAAGRLRRAIPGIGIAVEYTDRYVRDRHYEPGAWANSVSIPWRPDEELFARDAVKLLGRHPTLSEDELLGLAAPAVGDIVAVYHSGGLRLLEATAAGVSKGTALARLAGRLGIAAADTVAFGDMVNDLPMLAWAGRSYAMANAHPDVLAAADRVVPGNDDDGVATVVERLFPGLAPSVTDRRDPGRTP